MRSYLKSIKDLQTADQERERFKTRWSPLIYKGIYLSSNYLLKSAMFTNPVSSITTF